MVAPATLAASAVLPAMCPSALLDPPPTHAQHPRHSHPAWVPACDVRASLTAVPAPGLPVGPGDWTCPLDELLASDMTTRRTLGIEASNLENWRVQDLVWSRTDGGCSMVAPNYAGDTVSKADSLVLRGHQRQEAAGSRQTSRSMIYWPPSATLPCTSASVRAGPPDGTSLDRSMYRQRGAVTHDRWWLCLGCWTALQHRMMCSSGSSGNGTIVDLSCLDPGRDARGRRRSYSIFRAHECARP
jgi:hypothetical protein